MGAPRSVAHRILFGLQPDVGVTVTRSSLSEELTRTWLRRLQVHVRLQRFESTPPPPQALSSFEFSDGLTAVLRRWNAGGTLGRNDAFALIAPTELLAPAVVLGLDRAFGWTEAAEEPSFKPWDVAALVSLARRDGDALRVRAKQQPDGLCRSLAQLFDARDRPLTIVGCADESRVPLVWALHRLGAPYLQQTYGLRRAWTFSTYEVEHGDAVPNQPAVVFLPERTAGTVAGRRLVDVRVDQQASTSAVKAAQVWVEMFLADEDLGEEFTQRAVPAGARTSGQAAVAEGPARRPEPDRPSGDREPASLPESPGGLGDGEAIYRPSEQGERTQAPAWAAVQATGATDLGAAVESLTSAGDGVQFAYRFDRLRQMVSSPQLRQELRTRLAPAGYLRLTGLVAKFVPPDNQTERFDQLRTAAYGQDRSDLRDDSVLAFATEVLRSGVPEPDATGLVQDVDRVRGPRVLETTLSDLWRVEHQLPPASLDARGHGDPESADEPGEGLLGRLRTSAQNWAPLGKPGRPGTEGGSQRRPSTAVVGWGVAAVAALVLVGLGLVALVTTSGSGQGSAGPSSAAASAAAPAAPTAGAPTVTASRPASTAPASAGAPVGGTVADRTLVVRAPRSPADGDDVALVLRPATDDTYIYQAPCDPVGGEWVCSKLGVALPANPGGFEIVVVRAPRVNTAPSERLPNGAATVDTVRSADVVYRTTVAS